MGTMFENSETTHAKVTIDKVNPLLLQKQLCFYVIDHLVYIFIGKTK